LLKAREVALSSCPLVSIVNIAHHFLRPDAPDLIVGGSAGRIVIECSGGGNETFPHSTSSAIVLHWLILWGETTSLNCCHCRAYYSSPRWYECGERRWNDTLTGENRRTRRRSCQSASLSTTNSTRIDPGRNPGFRGERPATNRLSHGTALGSPYSYIAGRMNPFVYAVQRRSLTPPRWSTLSWLISKTTHANLDYILFVGGGDTESFWKNLILVCVNSMQLRHYMEIKYDYFSITSRGTKKSLVT
jgi:hypothetical protein